MKINFQVSQSATIDAQVVIARIQAKLKEKKYDILEVTENSVKFYDDPWVLRWRHQQAKRLDGGIFKISNELVTLNYYINLWSPLIALSIPLIVTLLAGAYNGSVFFIVFIIMVLCIQTITLKNVAKNMLAVIVGDDALV